MSQQTERILIIILSCVLGLALAAAVTLLVNMSNGQDEMLAVVRGNAERLAAIEQRKTPATARRFTADDGLSLTACLRLPYAEREPCLRALDEKIKVAR